MQPLIIMKAKIPKQRRSWKSPGCKRGDCGAGLAEAAKPALYTSAGSVSVFEVGIGFRYFFRFFQKSVRFSVSVFQNIAISVRFFGFIYLFANFHVGAQLIRYCTSEAHVHTYNTSSFSRRIHAVLSFFQKQVWYVISMRPVTRFRPLVHTKERHADQKSLFSSAIQSNPDASLSENMMIVLTITANY